MQVTSMYLRNLKSLSLRVAELYSRSQNLKVGHAIHPAYYRYG